MPIPTPQASHSHTGYFRGWVVSEKTAKAGNMEAIEAFLRWTYQPRNIAKFVLAVSNFHFNPVSGKVAQEYMKLPQIQKYSRLIDVQVEVIKTVQLVGMARGELCPDSGAIENSGVLGGVLQHIVLNNMSPSKAVEWGDQEFNKIVEP
jgi:ABC-type glycerol-3-phosphate transport system substrate-binding protein